jgi:hypothetical protein
MDDRITELEKEVALLRKQLREARATIDLLQNRQSRCDADYLPYEDDDRRQSHDIW